MSYLVRIINQSLSQCEESKNYTLEGEDYTVLMKVDNNCIPEGETKFEQVLREHKESHKLPVLGKGDFEPIVGFVFGKNRSHPIHFYEVAYIVNSEGKTLERVFGQYNKN